MCLDAPASGENRGRIKKLTAVETEPTWFIGREFCGLCQARTPSTKAGSEPLHDLRFDGEVVLLPCIFFLFSLRKKRH